MPRNMSFAITEQQIRDRTKTVTRRVGWMLAKKGDVLNACVKCMGLKPGEKIERICQIQITDIRRERLDRMTEDLEYGVSETTKEGYPKGTDKHWPLEFVKMFCKAMRIQPDDEITRIEFEYLEDE